MRLQHYKTFQLVAWFVGGLTEWVRGGPIMFRTYSIRESSGERTFVGEVAEYLAEQIDLNIHNVS